MRSIFFSLVLLLAGGAAAAFADEADEPPIPPEALRPAQGEQGLTLEKPAALRLPDPQMLEEIRALFEDEEALVEHVRALHQEQAALAGAEEEYLRAAVFLQDAEGVGEVARRVQERYALIREAYELGLDRYPNNARLHNYHGEVLYDHFDELDAALRAWHKAIGLDKNLSSPHNNLGLHYMRFGDYRRGLESMDRALELDPEHPDYLYNMAQFYLMHRPQIVELRGWPPERLYREAMRFSKEAMKQEPENYEFATNYAINFFKADEFGVQADWRESARAWAAARELAQEPPHVLYTHMMEARAWLRAGENARAIEALERVLEMNPHSAPARNLLERARAES